MNEQPNALTSIPDLILTQAILQWNAAQFVQQNRFLLQIC